MVESKQTAALNRKVRRSYFYSLLLPAIVAYSGMYLIVYLFFDIAFSEVRPLLVVSTFYFQFIFGLLNLCYFFIKRKNVFESVVLRFISIWMPSILFSLLPLGIIFYNPDDPMYIYMGLLIIGHMVIAYDLYRYCKLYPMCSED